MVLKVAVVGGTGEDFASLFRCLGDGGSSRYDSFSGKMVLKRPFIGDLGEALSLYVHCSDLLGDKASS